MSCLKTIRGMVASPPRVREKRKIFKQVETLIRITPACAGKTTGQRLQHVDYQDHPRVCGKNYKKIPDLHHTQGSHPRVREKPSIFTPIRPPDRDHPRVCGKNASLQS